jgi:hypothetical protein
MKRTFLFFLFSILLLGITENFFASPLIFKAKKDIAAEGVFELGRFDATKYKQIRIGIKVEGRLTAEKTNISKSVAEIELNAAKRELNRMKELLETGNIAKIDYDRAKDRLDKAQAIYDGALEVIYPNISIYAVEGLDEIFMVAFDDKINSRSLLLETPPSKIIVKVSGKGRYSLFVWGTL